LFSNSYKNINADHFEINKKDIFLPYVRYQYFFMIVSVISIFIIIYRVASLMQEHGGWWFYGDEKFEEAMIVGPVAHLVQFAKVCFLFLFFIYFHSSKKILIALILIGLLIAIAFIQVKYHLVWLILIGFLFVSLPKPPGHQLKSIFKISVLILIIMNLFWISMTFAWGTFSFQIKRSVIFSSIIRLTILSPVRLSWIAG